MTDKASWAPSALEDESCDSCGDRPSRHAGHGSYVCRKCYEGWWCPKCHYSLRYDGDKHVCPTPEEIVIRKRKTLASDLAMYDKIEEVEALLLERDQLQAACEKTFFALGEADKFRALFRRIEDKQAELNLRCLVCGEDQHATDCELMEAIGAASPISAAVGDDSKVR